MIVYILERAIQTTRNNDFFTNDPRFVCLPSVEIMDVLGAFIIPMVFVRELVEQFYDRVFGRFHESVDKIDPNLPDIKLVKVKVF